MSKSRFARLGIHSLSRAIWTGGICLVGAFAVLNARGSDSTNLAPAVHADDTNAQETLRVYLQLQEQLHATQLAIEQNRKEAKEAAVQNAEFLAGRLHDIETALAAQRARELEAMQSSNRVMLVVAGTFATFGFLVMLLVAYFQWRTVHGLAEMSTGLGGMRALPAGETGVVSFGPAEQSNVRLLGALERLEKRIYELEHLPPAALQENANATGYATDAVTLGEVVVEPNGDSPTPAETAAPRSARVEMLLGKGISMLSLDKPEAALNCFNEALNLDSSNSEALVRRGLALERLQKLEEALESYDRAIAANGSMTIAYLHKGGLFNRMERFDEALACYEKALRTQERKGN